MALNDLPSTIPALLARSVAARGPHDAIITTRETLSYDALDERTLRIARALVRLGASKGTRIALMLPDGALWLTTFLAAMRIGALVAPVSTLATAPELAHILRHSDAQIPIAVRRFLRHDYADQLSFAGRSTSELSKILRSMEVETPRCCIRRCAIDPAMSATGGKQSLVGRALVGLLSGRISSDLARDYLVAREIQERAI